MLVYSSTSSPIPGTEDSDDVLAEREADRHYGALHPTEAVVSVLARAVRQILRDHTAWIREGELPQCKRDAVFPLVFSILLWIPFEVDLRHSLKPSTKLSQEPYVRMASGCTAAQPVRRSASLDSQRKTT